MLLTVLLILSPGEVNAKEIVPEKMLATAYYQGTTNAMGNKARIGTCAVNSSAGMLGKTALVYKRDPDDTISDFIGIYEVEDAGCNKHVIDVRFDTLAQCEDFMKLVGDMKVYVFFVDAVG